MWWSGSSPLCNRTRLQFDPYRQRVGFLPNSQISCLFQSFSAEWFPAHDQTMPYLTILLKLILSLWPYIHLGAYVHLGALSNFKGNWHENLIVIKYTSVSTPIDLLLCLKTWIILWLTIVVISCLPPVGKSLANETKLLLICAKDYNRK